MSKINLAGGGSFRLFVISSKTKFLAGTTLEERTELSYKTQVLLSKIKLFNSKPYLNKYEDMFTYPIFNSA